MIVNACHAVPPDDPTHAVATEPAPAEVQYEPTIVLESERARVTIAPQVGRIVGFEANGSPDLLWRTTPDAAAEAKEQNRWVNLGGDKVWPSLQAMWPRHLPHGNQWPPDDAVDGAAWDVLVQEPHRVVIRSPVATGLEIRITREIRLDPERHEVVIHNRIERVAPSVFPVHIWSVSQVKQPDYVPLDVAQQWPQGRTFHKLHAIWGNQQKDKVSANLKPLAQDTALRWNLTHEGGGKVGTLGTWCAAVYDDFAVVHRTTLDPAGNYPDASNIQAYTHGEYVELETLSPQAHLQPGEAIENTVIWTVLPVEDRDDTELVAAIERVVAPSR